MKCEMKLTENETMKLNETLIEMKEKHVYSVLILGSGQTSSLLRQEQQLTGPMCILRMSKIPQFKINNRRLNRQLF